MYLLVTYVDLFLRSNLYILNAWFSDIIPVDKINLVIIVLQVKHRATYRKPVEYDIAIHTWSWLSSA